MTSTSEQQTTPPNMTGILAVLVGLEYTPYVPLVEDGFSAHDVFLTLAVTGPLLGLN